MQAKAPPPTKPTALKQLKYLFLSLTVGFAFLAAVLCCKWEMEGEQLRTVEGQLLSYRRANVVEGKLATLVRLDGVEAKEFNLGETLDHAKFVAALRDDPATNRIHLTVPGSVLQMTRPIVPAFYGVRVNGVSIRTIDEAGERNQTTLVYALIPVLIFGVAAVLAGTYERQLSG